MAVDILADLTSCLREYRVDLKDPNRDPLEQQREEVFDGSGNLFSSEIKQSLLGRQEEQIHMPVLDLDFRAALVPSTTEGHFHLYLERELTWPKYEKLLLALEEAGIVQEGFCRLMIQRKATYLRKPGLTKEAGDVGS